MSSSRLVKSITNRLPIRTALLGAALVTAAAGPGAAWADEYPPVRNPDAPIIKHMRSQGVEMVPMGHAAGLDGYIMQGKPTVGQTSPQLMIFYVTPDGNSVVGGFMIGKPDDPTFPVTQDQIVALVKSGVAKVDGAGGLTVPQLPAQSSGTTVNPPTVPTIPQAATAAAEPDRTIGPVPAAPDVLYANIQKLPSFEIGSPEAKEVYMIADANCAYCAGAWRSLEPLVKSKQIKVKVVMVGFLKDSSIGRFAAIMQSPNPAEAFVKNEQNYNFNTGEGGVEPAEMSEATKGLFLLNNQFLLDHDVPATPTLVGKDKRGNPRSLFKNPESTLVFFE